MRERKTLNRGQIHTLEGFAAAFIILGALLVAFQSVSVTPTSSSTASQQVETQNYVLADDWLSAAEESGALEEALLYWRHSDDGVPRFDEDGRDINPGSRGNQTYTNTVPDNTLGLMLERTFLQNGIAYNIELRCESPDDSEPETHDWMDAGQPSNHASTATQMVVLHQNDTLTHPESDDRELWETNVYSDICPNLAEGDEDSDYLEHTDSDVYNVMEVRLTVWRM